MLRFLSLGTMGGLFLVISPKLRSTISSYMDSGVNGMTANAPYSYIGIGLLVIAIFVFSVNRGAQPS